MATIKKKLEAGQYNLKDQVVSINRVTKVVKGGKNMSFAALVVVGDASAGVVGFGSGKAKEVPQAIRKGIEAAKKHLVRVNMTETTIPHQVLGRFGSGNRLEHQVDRRALPDQRERGRYVRQHAGLGRDIELAADLVEHREQRARALGAVGRGVDADDGVARAACRAASAHCCRLDAMSVSR